MSMVTAIEPVAAIANVQAGGTVSATSNATSSFANLMQQGIADLDANVGAAERAMSDLAAGKPVELHEVMIDMERARISVQTFVQIRNKLIESYQDLMRMQL